MDLDPKFDTPLSIFFFCKMRHATSFEKSLTHNSKGILTSKCRKLILLIKAANYRWIKKNLEAIKKVRINSFYQDWRNRVHKPQQFELWVSFRKSISEELLSCIRWLSLDTILHTLIPFLQLKCLGDILSVLLTTMAI